MAEAQNYKNHTRFDPLFHFVAVPIFLVNVIITLVVLIRDGGHHVLLHAWLFILAIGFMLTLGVARSSALRAQDRVIRLEEKLRLASLVSTAELAELDSLTMQQYIALRFASNPELPDLARRAVRENLTQKQIKEAIISWRADHHRV